MRVISNIKGDKKEFQSPIGVVKQGDERSLTPLGQELEIEDGLVLLNGVEIGKLNKVLKAGFHPVGELIVGSQRQEFDLATEDLYEYICNLAYQLYQQDKQASRNLSIYAVKKTQTPTMGGVCEKLLKELKIDVKFDNEDDKLFSLFLDRTLEPISDLISVAIDKGEQETDVFIHVLKDRVTEAQLDDIDLILAKVDAEAIKNNRVVLQRTVSGKEILWGYRLTTKTTGKGTEKEKTLKSVEEANKYGLGLKSDKEFYETLYTTVNAFSKCLVVSQRKGENRLQQHVFVVDNQPDSKDFLESVTNLCEHYVIPLDVMERGNKTIITIG